MTDGVEPGYTTTEFWLTSVTVLLGAVMSLYAAFGGNLSPEQRSTIIAVVVAAIPVLVAAYAIARGIRKKGTVALPQSTNSQPLS